MVDINNKYKIKLFKNTEFELDINSPITTIEGDSGSGKTLLLTCLRNIISNSDDSSLYGFKSKDIIVCLNENEVANILDKTNKFIFVDRYDIYPLELKKKIWKKMSEYNNNWIIMTRGDDIPNYGYSRESFKKIGEKIKNGKKVLFLENAY